MEETWALEGCLSEPRLPECYILKMSVLFQPLSCGVEGATCYSSLTCTLTDTPSHVVARWLEADRQVPGKIQ